MATDKKIDSALDALTSRSHFTERKSGKEFTAKQKLRLEVQGVIHAYAAKQNANSIAKYKKLLAGKWAGIMTWFDDHSREIDTCRRNINDFSVLGLKDQKAIIGEARTLFSSFRSDTNIGYAPTAHVKKDIRVWSEDQAALIEMIQYMNSGIRPEKQVNSYPEMIRQELDLAASTGITQLSTMNPTKVKNAFHSFLFSSGKKDEEAYDLLDKTIKKLKEVKTSRGVEGLFIDKDNARGLADLLEKAKEAAEAQQEDFDQDTEGGLWKAQEANLDRVFHMCYIFWRIAVESKMWPSFKSSIPQGIDLMIHVLNKQLHRIVGEETILKTFKQHTVMSHLEHVLDGIGSGGSRDDHKYQHPLMVTTKRFLAGLSTITNIPVISQLLNHLETGSASSINSILTYFKMDLETTERQVERSSTWLLHNYLKGYGSAFYYTGNVTGNVLSGTLTLVPKPAQSKPDVMSVYANIARFSSLTSAQMSDILANEAAARADNADSS